LRWILKHSEEELRKVTFEKINADLKRKAVGLEIE